jgi:FlaA1/EpsC-like NDP-sugar epimerase
MQIKKSLLRLPRLVKKTIAALCDTLYCVFSVWFAFGLRLDQWGLLEGGQWWALIIAICLSLPLFVRFGLYRAILRHIGSAAFASMARVFIVYSALYFGVIAIIGIDGVPRSVGVIQPILLFIGVGAIRYFVRQWLGNVERDQILLKKNQGLVFIYGAGEAGRQLALSLHLEDKFVVKGFIDDDECLQGRTINGIEVYPSSNIQNLIRQLGITDIFLAISSVSDARRSEIISYLFGCGVRVKTLPRTLEVASSRFDPTNLHELDLNDLLGRKVVPPNLELLEKNVKNKVVLVTGAGGSIGSELCRQIINLSPNSLVLIDNNEYALYLISEELKNYLAKNDSSGFNLDHTKRSPLRLISRLASVRDEDLVSKIFIMYRPETVFHAAAYKHVPLVEQNPEEGIRNNVFGTYNCAKAAIEYGIQHFILISSDKAVRPTNVMGASKRIAELVLQAMASYANEGGYKTTFSMVRFGNVLGSSGSVAPLFLRQIQAGGPITLTHPEVTRYFMTISEAAQLVIQSSAMATGGDVFVLDMGEPVRIYELAKKMIYLSGLMVKDELNHQGDIEIQVTGLRSGEKLYEELLIGNNPRSTDHPKIMKAHEEFLPWDELELELEKLNLALQTCDLNLIRASLKRLVPGYKPIGEEGAPYPNLVDSFSLINDDAQ